MAEKPPYLRPLRDLEHGRTLADSLVQVADSVRQLATNFGVRPYRVRLVWLRYTQAEFPPGGLPEPEELALDDMVGAGGVSLLREIEVLPTPRVQTTDSIGRRLMQTGLSEAGNISISRISRSFSEDVLRGLLPEYRDPAAPEVLAPGIQFFWEVQEDRIQRFSNIGAGGPLPTDDRAVRRKFQLSGVPFLSGGGAHWSVLLTRADGERGRDGQVSEVLP